MTDGEFEMHQADGLLLPGERIDDLERDGYKIIQKAGSFCFGTDAVLLSCFARVKEGERVIDLGTGTGVIPILLLAKTEGRHFTGLEIQKDSADMAKRSILLNKLQERIAIVQGDIKEADRIFGKASFDVVTTNPPYMNDLHGIKNQDAELAIARHEVKCTLEDVVRQSSLLLKPNGRLYMIHRPHRLVEIINTCVKYDIEPKRIRFVHSYKDREANMVLIEGLRGGRSMVKVEPPIIIFDKKGSYTTEVLRMYGKL